MEPPPASAPPPCLLPFPLVTVSLKNCLYSLLYSVFCFFSASCFSSLLNVSFSLNIPSLKSCDCLLPMMVSLLVRRNSLSFLLLIYCNFKFYMILLRISLFFDDIMVLQFWSLLNWLSTYCLYFANSFSLRYFSISFSSTVSRLASLEVVRYWLPLGFS